MKDWTTTATKTPLTQDPHWASFCFTILALKIVMLILDPEPKLFLGDSSSYIWTAISGWIPDDRSFVYGYVIRYLSLWTHSLTPLLIVQAVVGGSTAIMAAVICGLLTPARPWLCYVVGFLCAVDPLQVVWERYVMAETLSLCLYTFVLYCAFRYFRTRRFLFLLLAHAFGVAAISLRMSYLLLTQLHIAILPLLAFWPSIRDSIRGRLAWPARFQLMKTVAIHFLVSGAAVVLLHGAYKQLNGSLAERHADYLHSAGLHLLAFWAPALQPGDAADPRLARIIEQGSEFKIGELLQRNGQRFGAGRLIDRWQKAEPELRKADQIAKQTALNALRRDPLKIFALGVQTFAEYWTGRPPLYYAQLDLGHVDLTLAQREQLIEYFHFAPDPNITAAPRTLLQRYFLAAWPYYFVVLLCPIAGLVAVFVAYDKQPALLMLFHLSVLSATGHLFSGGPTVRYLQPVSFLFMLTVAMVVDQWQRNGRTQISAYDAAGTS